jgi:hypothetical protein
MQFVGILATPLALTVPVVDAATKVRKTGHEPAGHVLHTQPSYSNSSSLGSLRSPFMRVCVSLFPLSLLAIHILNHFLVNQVS